MDNDMIHKKIDEKQVCSMIAWIMPVFNGEKYVLQAVESILLQPCRDFEVWVVDDGSTDSTAQIVQGIHDNRVHYLYQENAGVSAARNYGIQNSRSTYIAFLDADDVLCKNAYDDDVHGILEKEEFDLISFSYYRADQRLNKGNKVSQTIVDTLDNKPSIDYYKHPCSFVYHRSLFSGKTHLRFPEKIQIGEDVVVLFLAARASSRVLLSNKPLFLYRNNITSVLHKSSNEERAMNGVWAWDWCKRQCTEKSDRDECDARLFSIVAVYIQSGCMEGVPVTTIQNMLTAVQVREALENYDALWQRSKNIYEAFIEDPEAYWKNQRKKGRMHSLAGKVVRLPGIRQLYMYMKYKEDVRYFVPC